MISYAGVRIQAAAGWSATARRQPVTRPGRPGNVVVHLTTSTLPRERGDFGSGAVDLLGSADVFLALLEYDREEAATALFEHRGLPTVRPAEFSPGALQRVLPGQSGGQWFFQAAGRPFCLFAVLGNHARRSAGAARINDLLTRMTVEST